MSKLAHRLHAAMHQHGPQFEGEQSERYDRRAHRWNGSMYRRVAEQVAAAAPPSGSVVDIGTGPGHLLAEIARRRGDLELIGVDVSADMVAIGRRHVAESGLPITFHQGDAAALPLPDASVDLAVSSLSMHHWGDLAGAAAELARVVKPGGRAVIYDARLAPTRLAMRELERQPAFAGRVRRERSGWWSLSGVLLCRVVAEAAPAA